MWFLWGASSLFASSLVAPGVLPHISPVAPVSFSLSPTSFSLFIVHSLQPSAVDMCGLWVQNLGSFPRSPHRLANGLSFRFCGMERIVVRVSWVYYED